MSAQALIEAAGIMAVLVVVLFGSLCIVANEMFRRRGEPDGEGGE